MEGGADSSKLAGAAGVCQETEVTNTTEAFWQHMKEKAADKIVDIKRHHLRFAGGAIVLPTEADATVLTGKQSAVCNGNAVGVAPEIVKDLLWSAERAFGVDDPGEVTERLQIACESGGFDEPGEMPEEPQLAGFERGLKAFEKQPAVEPREHMDWEEKIGAATDPASVRGETSAGNNEVSMRVMAPTPTIP